MKLNQWIVVCVALFVQTLQAQNPQSFTATIPPPTTQETIVETPVHVKGLTIGQIASCVVIDQLPWVFRKQKRQSRLLFKDKLRLSTHTEFSIWEAHQVMDESGYVSYVFRRPLPGGQIEALVTKETHYNRIVEGGAAGVRRVVDVRNLMTLVDKPALTFYAEDGTYAVFKPGLAGKGSFIITYKGGTAPVFLQGSSCERVGAAGANPFTAPTPGAAAGSSGAAAPAGAGASAGAAGGAK